MRNVPPCKQCGSHTIKENNLRIDFIRGYWRGEWTCENGHRNVIR
jgi:hypothetical protein